MSDTPAVQPALTAEEWAKWLSPEMQYDRECDRLDYFSGSYGGGICIDGRYRDDDLRAVAALCLYGQPFGFTQEDVDAITRCLESDVWITVYQYEDAEPLESIRARIAALLPPTP